MKKKITKRPERKFQRKVIRDTRGVMLNPVDNAELRLIAEKKLAYAMKRLARIEGSYVHLITNGSLLENDPKWVYFDRQARHLDRDWFTVENW